MLAAGANKQPTFQAVKDEVAKLDRGREPASSEAVSWHTLGATWLSSLAKAEQNGLRAAQDTIIGWNLAQNGIFFPSQTRSCSKVFSLA